MAENSEDSSTSAETPPVNTNTASNTTEGQNNDKQLLREFCIDLRPFKILQENDFQQNMENTANCAVPYKETISKELLTEEFNRARTETMKSLDLVNYVAISIEDWKFGETGERNMLTATAHFVNQSKLVSQILFTTEVKLWEETYIIEAIKHGLDEWKILKKVVCITTRGRNNEVPLRKALFSTGIPHSFSLDDTITLNVKEIFNILNLKRHDNDSAVLINNNDNESFNWHDQYVLLKQVTENKVSDYTEEERKELTECFQMLKLYEDLKNLSSQQYLTLSSIWPLFIGIFIVIDESTISTPKGKEIQEKITDGFVLTERDLAVRAAFMDPRFKSTILEGVHITEKIQQEIEMELNELINVSEHNTTPSNLNMLKENKLLKLVAELENDQENTVASSTSSLAKIMLNQYMKTPDLHLDGNPLQFWEDFHRIYKNNQLYGMAHKYLCIPGTTNRAESFSGDFPWMKCFRDSVIFYERRNLLEYEYMNEILFLHSYYSRN